MKRIGSIKGVPIVEGNPNEITKNQILYKESNKEVQLSKRDSKGQLNTITGSNSDDGDALVYYKINNPDVIEYLIHLPIVSAIIKDSTSPDTSLILEKLFTDNSGITSIGVDSYLAGSPSILNLVIGAAFLKKETYIVNITGVGELVLILPKGGVKEKLKAIKEFTGLSDENIEAMDLFISEISKEEYYALATVK